MCFAHDLTGKAVHEARIDGVAAGKEAIDGRIDLVLTGKELRRAHPTFGVVAKGQCALEFVPMLDC